MKILHIGKYYPPFFGGVEKVNYDLVNGLNKLNVPTDQLCFNKGRKNSIEKSDSGTIYRCGVVLSILGQPISISFLKNLFRLLGHYDIIHLHLPNPLASLAVFFLRKNQKLVLHWHNDIIKQKVMLFFYRPLQTMMLKRADAIIGTTPQYVTTSKDLLNFQEKSHVIPIGVNEADIIVNQEYLDKLKNRYESKKIVLSVGRLSEYKGYEYLIKAAKHLDEHTIILIIGIGEEKDKLEALILEEAMQHKVKLLGKVPHDKLGAYFQLCDVFCMSSISRNEGFGIVQIEAMLKKKPIVTTEIKGSGISYGNINNVTGYTVPIKEPIKLAKAILKILNDQNLALKLGEKAYLRARSIFSTKKMIKETIKIYESIINKK